MAWSSEHKQKTRKRIISSAAKLFTAQGFDNVGINQVMEDAGLTRGAFYSHFKSKSDLYAQSILMAGTKAHADLVKQIPETECTTAARNELVKQYLSFEHSQGKSATCPLAFLATDIGQRNQDVKTTYTQAFKHFVENLIMSENNNDQHDKLRRAVLMIGGLAISRALNDDELIQELFIACQNGVLDTTLL